MCVLEATFGMPTDLKKDDSGIRILDLATQRVFLSPYEDLMVVGLLRSGRLRGLLRFQAFFIHPELDSSIARLVIRYVADCNSSLRVIDRLCGDSLSRVSKQERTIEREAL